MVLRGVTPLPCSQAVRGGLFHWSPRLRVAGYLVIHTQPGIQVNLNSGHLPIQTKSINAAVTERKKTGVTSMDIAITKSKRKPWESCKRSQTGMCGLHFKGQMFMCEAIRESNTSQSITGEGKAKSETLGSEVCAWVWVHPYPWEKNILFWI